MIKSAHPEIGEDIKVMGVRRDRDVHLTVAVAFVGANLNNTEDYLVKKAGIYNAARAVACVALDQEGSVELNAADVPPDSLYFDRHGTSAEAGVDGEAGRSTRANGLSVAGKKSSEPRRQAVRCRGGADCRRPTFGKSTRSTPPSPISSARSAIRWVSRKSFTCALGPPPALQWWISVSTSRKSRSQILERLDRFADDLLDGRLGFDPWPSRIPAEARIRSG